MAADTLHLFLLFIWATLVFLFILMLSIFVRVFRNGFRLPEEKNRKPRIWKRIGASIGKRKMNWPFARVAIYNDMLVLRWRKDIILDLSALASVTIKQRIFVVELQLQFDDALSSEKLILRTVGDIGRLHDAVLEGLCEQRSMPG